jgi:hypothetical protein
MEQEKPQSDTIIRSFQIDGFGVWNADYIRTVPCWNITATFKDAQGDTLDLSNVTVIYPAFNGLFRFWSNQVEVAGGVDNMILGIYNGRLTYISYQDYRKLDIDATTGEQTFIMTIVSEENNNYDYIKTLLK